METSLREKELGLVEKAQRGDQEAFSKLVEEYQGLIYNLAYRMCGEREEACDISQEAFLRAYEHLKKFQKRAKFSTWLYRIAINVAINHLKKKRPQDIPLEEITLSGQSPGPRREAESRELQEMVKGAIVKLPPLYRAVVVLYHQQGLSYEEIAAYTGCPLGTVKVHLFRAKEILRKILGEALEGEEVE